MTQLFRTGRGGSAPRRRRVSVENVRKVGGDRSGGCLQPPSGAERGSLSAQELPFGPERGAGGLVLPPHTHPGQRERPLHLTGPRQPPAALPSSPRLPSGGSALGGCPVAPVARPPVALATPPPPATAPNPPPLQTTPPHCIFMTPGAGRGGGSGSERRFPRSPV